MLGTTITGLAAVNVYEVLPDNERCIQHPCLYLRYLIDNHQYYFTSNTKIVFSEAEYYIIANMLIQNISNFSLISTSYSEIICSPQKFIYFHNVVNLTIRNMGFSKCGNSLNNDSPQSYWASMIFNQCTNLLVSDVYINYPVGYGIIAYNMFGHNILENILVHIGRQKPLNNSQLLTCSYGVHLSYFDSDDEQTDKNNVTVTISDIWITLMSSNERRCKGCCGFNYYQRFRGIFEVVLKQHHYAVLITIKNSRFSYLIGNILMINAKSHGNNSICFNNCIFTNTDNFRETKNRVNVIYDQGKNFSQSLVSFYYRIQSDNCSKNVRFYVSFIDCDFRHNTYNSKLNDDAIKHVEAVINCNHDNRSIVLITFRNITFYKNEFVLLNITSGALPMYFEPFISIITEDKFHIQGNVVMDKLIYLNNVRMHFNGITKFIENQFFQILFIQIPLN